MEAKPGFSAFAKSGFQIRFENGWTVSVQFGPMHYCSNRDISSAATLVKAMAPEMLQYGDELSCANAEVAVWDASGEYYKFDGNDERVKGWVKPADLLALLNEIAAK